MISQFSLLRLAFEMHQALTEPMLIYHQVLRHPSEDSFIENDLRLIWVRIILILKFQPYLPGANEFDT